MTFGSSSDHPNSAADATAPPARFSAGLFVLPILVGALAFNRGIDPGPAFLVGLPLALLAGIVRERSFKDAGAGSAVEGSFHAVIAVAMTAGYLAWHSGILVDDAGFIIRYLNQSALGCWYCFNAGEGPIFGISSFSHGVAGLVLFQGGFGTPEECLRFSNALGTFLTAWLLMRLFSRLSRQRLLVIPLAFTTLFGAKSWMMIGGSGMEVPLHTAIVLAALVCLVEGRGPGLWLWLSLAVISKLDAAPIALAFGALHLRDRLSTSPNARATPFAEALLWAGVPLSLWVAFSTGYFGSPLPHSASAKLLLHRSTLEHGFPFMERYLNGDWLRILLGLFLFLWSSHLGLQRRMQRPVAGETAPGWAFVGLMALYYFYNPAERMEWYYALPDLFLILQVILSLQCLGHWLRPGLKDRVGLALITVGMLCLVDAAQGMKFFTRYLRSLEGERLAIGAYVAESTAKGEVMLAGHGLFGAWTPATVVDYSGLNSRVALNYGGNWGGLVRAIRPDTVLAGGYPYYLAALRGLPYRIETTFYEAAEQGAPPWHVFRRTAQGEFWMAYADQGDFTGVDTVFPHLTSLSVEGKTLTWAARAGNLAPRVLRMGVLRPIDKDALLIAQTFWEGALLQEMSLRVPAGEERQERSLYWEGLVLPLDEHFSGAVGYTVTLRLAGGASLRVYDPILTRD